MLEQFMKTGYAIPNYQYMNDRLIYVDYVNRKYNYKQVAVLPIVAYRYQGNLFGLFGKLGVPANLFLYAMYLNGYNNPSNYDGVKFEFKLPAPIPLTDY